MNLKKGIKRLWIVGSGFIILFNIYMFYTMHDQEMTQLAEASLTGIIFALLANILVAHLLLTVGLFVIY